MTSENNTHEKNDLIIAIKSGDTVLMRFDPESNPESFVSGFGVEKIPSNADLSNFLRTIPEIASAIALNNSFRIVMPAGVVGKLMTLVKNPSMSGLLTTSIVGKNNQIIATAGLAPMSGFVVPVIVWTILSFLTGQFFLTQIQKNTRAIFDELRNILFFLVAQEESALCARIEFLNYVGINFSALSQNAEMRVSTLTNLQKANIESLAGLKLWVRNIKKELEDVRTTIELIKSKKDVAQNIDKVASLVGETQQNINRAIASWQCYFLGSTLEIQLGSIFEPCLLEYIDDSLSKQSEDLRVELEKAIHIWNDSNNITSLNESPRFQVGQISAIGKELIGYTDKIKNVINSTKEYIKAIKDLEENGINLLYYNNAFYRPQLRSSKAN